MKAAVYGATRNIYEDVIPSIKSLLINSDVDKIYVLAEDDELPFYLPSECEVINVSNQQWFPRGGLNYNTQWTYIILLRCVYSELFPDLDHILSLDNDVIIKENISELWDFNLDANYFAAVKEPYNSRRLGKLYTCIGVALFNLDMFRQNNMQKILVEKLSKHFYYYPEQDVLNHVCQGYIKELPPEYGMSPYTTQCDNPKIEHFAASNGQWRDYDIVNYYRDIPWSEIRKERLNDENINSSSDI